MDISHAERLLKENSTFMRMVSLRVGGGLELKFPIDQEMASSLILDTKSKTVSNLGEVAPEIATKLDDLCQAVNAVTNSNSRIGRVELKGDDTLSVILQNVELEPLKKFNIVGSGAFSKYL